MKKPKQWNGARLERFISHLPRANDRAYSVNLTDHRGRLFSEGFFVAGDHEKRGLFVWGRSRSGATQIVARPKKARVARGPNGNRVWMGWTTRSKAELVAQVLSDIVISLQASDDQAGASTTVVS